MAGLTTDGFVTKTLTTIREDINTQLRAAFGPSINLGDKSIFGQLVGIIAERIALLWELAEQVNSSQDPDKASGAALDALCLLTGTFRSPATYSAVVLTLTGADTTVVPAQSQVSTDSTTKLFATDADATITALDAWVTLTAYVVGDRVTNDDRCYECTVAGTSGATGPVDTVSAEVDGSVTWTYLGEGDSAVDVNATATESGVVEAFSRDITTIVNAISGWQSVINLLDANTGNAQATDSELRTLRELELRTGGSSPVDALRAELLDVPLVEAVTIFVNNTDTTDADGVPPHSIEALVRGPESPDADFDQSVWDALLAGVAAGIRTYGLVVGTATDDQLTEHTMAFSRPEEKLMYVDITLIVDPDEYPVDGDDAVKEAIVAWGDIQSTGKDAVSSRIAAAAFGIPGVLDVVTCYIDDAPSPATEATFPISLRQLAVYDTSRITVTTSDGVP